MNALPTSTRAVGSAARSAGPTAATRRAYSAASGRAPPPPQNCGMLGSFQTSQHVPPSTIADGGRRRVRGESPAARVVDHGLRRPVERVAVVEDEDEAEAGRLGRRHEGVEAGRREVVHARRPLDRRPVEVVANPAHARRGQPGEGGGIERCTRRTVVRVDRDSVTEPCGVCPSMGHRRCERGDQRDRQDGIRHGGRHGGVPESVPLLPRSTQHGRSIRTLGDRGTLAAAVFARTTAWLSAARYRHARVPRLAAPALPAAAPQSRVPPPSHTTSPPRPKTKSWVGSLTSSPRTTTSTRWRSRSRRGRCR